MGRELVRLRRGLTATPPAPDLGWRHGSEQRRSRRSRGRPRHLPPHPVRDLPRRDQRHEAPGPGRRRRARGRGAQGAERRGVRLHRGRRGRRAHGARRTAPRSTGGRCGRARCATSRRATSPSTSSAGDGRRRCCSPRSASWRWRTPTPTSRSRGPRHPSAFRTRSAIRHRFPMEEVRDAAPGGSRLFQLYWSASDDLNASLLRRAEASGCEAIVVTLDTHLLGWRTRDLDLAYLPFTRGMGIAQYTSDPVFQQLVRERVRAAGSATRRRRRAAAREAHAARPSRRASRSRARARRSPARACARACARRCRARPSRRSSTCSRRRRSPGTTSPRRASGRRCRSS